MSEPRPILVAMKPRERDDFLPEPVWAELESLGRSVAFFDTTDRTAEDLHSEIEARSPEVLVTCWSTPRLLADRAEQVATTVSYLCHLAGSVRSLVPRRCIEHGLLVTNWAWTVGRSVAEAGLLLILAALRQSTRWAIEIHTEAAWRPSMYEPVYGLFGRRVGIHGFGSVAKALVELLRPFGVPISAFSRGVPETVYRELDVEPAADLPSLFASSDVLVEAEALREDTRHSITEDLLRLLPEDAVFVNVGRGAVVDEAALERIAVEGRLRIGLDVYEREPLPVDSPLRGLKNVTLLPHIGGPTRDRRVDCGRHGVQNVARFVRGKTLLAPIDLDSYDRMT